LKEAWLRFQDCFTSAYVPSVTLIDETILVPDVRAKFLRKKTCEIWKCNTSNYCYYFFCILILLSEPPSFSSNV